MGLDGDVLGLPGGAPVSLDLIPNLGGNEVFACDSLGRRAKTLVGYSWKRRAAWPFAAMIKFIKIMQEGARVTAQWGGICLTSSP